MYPIVTFLYVSCSGSITSVEEEKANLSAIVVILWFRGLDTSWQIKAMPGTSVHRGFLFLLVLGMGCIILLWHSLGLPYDYLKSYDNRIMHSCLDITKFKYQFKCTKNLGYTFIAVKKLR